MLHAHHPPLQGRARTTPELAKWAGQVITVLRDTAKVHAVTSGATGELVASAGADGAVLLGNRARLPLRHHTAGVRGVAVSQNGRYLASGGEDHAVVLWDVATRTRWAMLSGHTDRVLGIAWHPDGTTVYTGSADRTVIP